MSEETPQTQPEPNEPSWYLDDNTPGVGERPDWMPVKYKKASDVGKAYQELEKKLGAFTGAPERYDLSKLEIDENDLIVKELSAVAQEMNMSQEGLEKFMGRFASAADTANGSYLEEQVARLGKDGERELVQFKNALKDNFVPEEAELVKDWVRTADDLRVFNRIMAHSKMSVVPTQHTMAMANHFESEADLRKELNKNVQRYDSDKAYQKDWSNRMAMAVKRERG